MQAPTKSKSIGRKAKKILFSKKSAGKTTNTPRSSQKKSSLKSRTAKPARPGNRIKKLSISKKIRRKSASTDLPVRNLKAGTPVRKTAPRDHESKTPLALRKPKTLAPKTAIPRRKTKTPSAPKRSQSRNAAADRLARTSKGTARTGTVKQLAEEIRMLLTSTKPKSKTARVHRSPQKPLKPESRARKSSLRQEQVKNIPASKKPRGKIKAVVRPLRKLKAGSPIRKTALRDQKARRRSLSESRRHLPGRPRTRAAKPEHLPL